MPREILVDLDLKGNWITNVVGIEDGDRDTKVTLEESTDEDVVRIYANGTEIINIDDT